MSSKLFCKFRSPIRHGRILVIGFGALAVGLLLWLGSVLLLPTEVAAQHNTLVGQVSGGYFGLGPKTLDVEIIPPKNIAGPPPPWMPPGPGQSVFVAKFVCGTILNGGPLIPATYRTSINVLNPTLLPLTVSRRVTVTNFTEPLVGGPVVGTLGPHQGFQLDCGAILQLLSPPPNLQLPFWEGYVFIYGTNILDVTGVWTSGTVN